MSLQEQTNCKNRDSVVDFYTNSTVYHEAPNADLYSFDGSLHLANERKVPLTLQNMVRIAAGGSVCMPTFNLRSSLARVFMLYWMLNCCRLDQEKFHFL